jgi:hypothetical protein
MRQLGVASALPGIEGAAHKHIVYHPRKLEPYFIELGAVTQH